MLEDRSAEQSVDVVKTIYGGSKIVIGRYTRFVKDPQSGYPSFIVKGTYP